MIEFRRPMTIGTSEAGKSRGRIVPKTFAQQPNLTCRKSKFGGKLQIVGYNKNTFIGENAIRYCC